MLKAGMSWSDPAQRVLVVDDEEPIRKLIASLLGARGYRIATAGSGREALEKLALEPFDLVVSDINMPGLDGIALLTEISGNYPDVGVLMLTGCEDVTTAVGAMKGGALDYVLKPFQPDDLIAAVERALDKRRELITKSSRLQLLEQTVLQQTEELRDVLAHLDQASQTTLEALVTALDAREHETHAHSQRVGEYTVRLAHEMGVDAESVKVIRRGAMLHDIGKIGIPDRVLLKPGRLTDTEWDEMRRHPQIGYWILRGIEGLKPAAEIVLAHHERYDGRGYPRQLSGEDIPLGARIFSVMDTFDAITSDRPYRGGRSYPEALGEIEAGAGGQFDPRVVEHFRRIPEGVWREIGRRSTGEKVAAVHSIPPLVLG